MVQTNKLQLEKERDELALRITDLHFERYGERWAEFGESAREKCLEDTIYHLDYLKEAVETNSPDIFGEYVDWARVMLSSRNIEPEDLRLNLLTIREVLAESLKGDEAHSTLPILDEAIASLKQPDSHPESWIQDDNPWHREANAYLQALLRGDREGAARIVDELVSSGAELASIYEYIFQTTQYEVGRLWQTNEITVAHEHYCTAATQNIMARLYPKLFETPKRGLRLVSCSVAQELHEMGIRMVTDLFELDGWDTYYLGANLPDDQICQAVERYRADLVAISVTLPIRVSHVKRLIERLRSKPSTADIPILVGGYPFVTVPDLWKRVGADGSAMTARDAVRKGGELIQTKRGGVNG